MSETSTLQDNGKNDTKNKDSDKRDKSENKDEESIFNKTLTWAEKLEAKSDASFRIFEAESQQMNWLMSSRSRYWEANEVVVASRGTPDRQLKRSTDAGGPQTESQSGPMNPQRPLTGNQNGPRHPQGPQTDSLRNQWIQRNPGVNDEYSNKISKVEKAIKKLIADKKKFELTLTDKKPVQEDKQQAKAAKKQGQEEKQQLREEKTLV